MRSNLGRFHRPMSRGLVNNMLTMNNLGDGSTLSLDFTTMGGVLDPRLTFSRASTANFVNSSGYVQFADANMLVNSPMQDAASPASGWNFFSITGGTISIPTTGSRKVATTGASQQPFTHQTLTISQGLTFTLSLVVTEITGTISYQNICGVDGAASSQLWVNGVNITATSSQAAVGNYCLIFVGGSGSHTIRIGTGASSGSSGVCSMTFNSARVQPGSFTTTTYIPSTLSAAYHAPRFDYSPTNIGQPRGLLVEGSSINACTYSEDFANAAWNKVNITQTPASGTSPDNTNTATLLAEIVGYGKHSLDRSITVTAGNIYTFSVFLKEASSNSRRYACVQVADGQATAARNTVVVDLQTGIVTANGVTNGTLVGSPTDVAHSITSYKDGWYRVTVTMKFVSSPCYPVVMLSDISTLFGGPNQPFYTAASPVKGLLVWGAQLELGSGASSYIPTGASQVTRAVDTAIIAAGTNFSSWYTGGTTGTFVSNWYGSASSSTARSVIATSDVDDKHLHLYQTASALTLRLADFGALATVTTANNLTANALTKGAFSYAGTATSLCLNGGTVATNTLGFSVAPTFLSIGGPSTTGTTITDTSVMLNNSIRTIKYYPTRLTDAQIKDITT